MRTSFFEIFNFKSIALFSQVFDDKNVSEIFKNQRIDQVIMLFESFWQNVFNRYAWALSFST